MYSLITCIFHENYLTVMNVNAVDQTRQAMKSNVIILQSPLKHPNTIMEIVMPD